MDLETPFGSVSDDVADSIIIQMWCLDEQNPDADRDIVHLASQHRTCFVELDCLHALISRHQLADERGWSLVG